MNRYSRIQANLSPTPRSARTAATGWVHPAHPSTPATARVATRSPRSNPYPQCPALASVSAATATASDFAALSRRSRRLRSTVSPRPAPHSAAGQPPRPRSAVAAPPPLLPGSTSMTVCNICLQKMLKKKTKKRATQEFREKVPGYEVKKYFATMVN